MTDGDTILVTLGRARGGPSALIAWLDSWLRKNPHRAPQTVVHHRQSPPSRYAVNVKDLSPEALMTAIPLVGTVVSDVGLAELLSARAAGVNTVWVTDPGSYREKDSEQEKTLVHLAEGGRVDRCMTEAEFHLSLDKAVEGRSSRDAGWAGARPPARTVPGDLPKVAYLVFSHRPDRSLDRLLARITALDPDAEILVDHDIRGAEALTETAVGLAKKVTLSKGGRGDVTAVLRLQRALELALATDADFVAVLSGEDYPSGDLTQMRREILRTRDGWVKSFPVESRDTEWSQREGRLRYGYRWTSLTRIGNRTRRLLRPLHALNLAQPWWRVNVSYGALRLGRRDGDLLPDDLDLFGGPSWCTISRRAARHVLDTFAARPDVRRWCRSVLCPDEVLIPTLIGNAPDLNPENRSDRFVDFSSSHLGHPRYLGLDDLPAVTASNANFCRKVNSEKLMDALDEHVDSLTSA